jgi:hypothetical protein
MAQVTIYIPNNLEKKIKQKSKELNISISKFITKLLEQKIQNSWSMETKKLVGAWDDFEDAKSLREPNTKDIKREEF